LRGFFLSGAILSVTRDFNIAEVSGASNLHECLTQLENGINGQKWNLVSDVPYAGGDEAKTWEITSENTKDVLILKVEQHSSANEDFKLEVLAQQKAAKIGVAPAIYRAWTCRLEHQTKGMVLGLIAMEHLGRGLEPLKEMRKAEVQEAMISAMDRLAIARIPRIDTHPWNWLWDTNTPSKLHLIDYSDSKSLTKLDTADSTSLFALSLDAMWKGHFDTQREFWERNEVGFKTFPLLWSKTLELQAQGHDMPEVRVIKKFLEKQRTQTNGKRTLLSSRAPSKPQMHAPIKLRRQLAETDVLGTTTIQHTCTEYPAKKDHKKKYYGKKHTKKILW
jgi:hypothetical protein